MKKAQEGDVWACHQEVVVLNSNLPLAPQSWEVLLGALFEAWEPKESFKINNSFRGPA